jgi:hypothetical protein
MKIQCSCGAKYAIDVTPGMQPVKFVCQACGQDYSAFVNELIRKETGEQPMAAAPPPASPPPPAAAAPAPPPPPTPGGSRLRISRPQTAETPAAKEEAPVSKYCQRHRTELTTSHCQVCQKPICPKCMETFGPFCSPFCRNKVEGVSMEAPVYIGDKFAAQREYWRKVGLISGVAGGVLACVLGFWFWYAWIGSQPHATFSVRWDNISHSGTSRVVAGADGNQLLFLHGGTLARYNLKTKQKVWSLDLVTSEEVADALKKEDEYDTRIQHRTGENPNPMIPRMREKMTRIGLESALSLYGEGKTIWVAKMKSSPAGEMVSDDTSDDTSDDSSPNVSEMFREQFLLTHYDWTTGNVLQQITVTNEFNALTERGDELVGIEARTNGAQIVTHISLNDGTMRTEEFFGPPAPESGPGTLLAGNGRGSAGPQGGGLPLSPNQAGQPLNPAKVAEQAQNMTLPGRIALPALIANSEHNQQIIKEARADDNQDQSEQKRRAARRRSASQQPASQQSGSDDSDDSSIPSKDYTMVPDGDNFIAVGAMMIKENVIQRDAMRAPPQHSALDSPNLGMANEAQAVNEQLNEIQRNNGGGTVMEDQSTYKVVLRRTTSPEPDWTGQVIGTPQFYAFNTQNVLAAGKTITVFDKTNKKLWQASLSYGVTGSEETNGTLYVFDQAVLTAFDASNGNVRWRIPSVGVDSLFFDDKGMIYINTTSGNPDDIKYSQQIDITKSTQAVVMKVDPANGTILWRSTPGGLISYVSGKYIYSYRVYDPGDEEDNADDATSAIMGTAYLKIYRINPDNGHLMWEHDEGRAAMDVEFNQNTISIVLKKEVEVLHFISL